MLNVFFGQMLFLNLRVYFFKNRKFLVLFRIVEYLKKKKHPEKICALFLKKNSAMDE